MSKTIEIDVANKIATLVDDDVSIVCGNSDYVIDFDFDAEWSGITTKTARFSCAARSIDVVFTGASCPAPIIINTSGVEIGVFAGSLSTTTSAYVPCKRSILDGGELPVDPTPSVYEQIMQLLNGFSAAVTKSGTTSTISITDPRGTTTAQVLDGTIGQDGVGIQSITYARTDAQGNNIYTITLTNGTTAEITAPRGPAGATPSLDAYRTAAAQDIIDNGKQSTISDLATIRSGAEAGATAYQKPVNGIPSTDMDSAVQTSLGKADSALQEHQSLAAYRTAAAQNSIDQGKVDKVAGKGLSANDYTNADKAKVAAALTQHQSLTAYRTAAAQDIIDNGKQSTISDLATIRSGAALGATALQSVPDTYRTAAAQDILDAGKLSLASQALTDAQKAQVWSNQTMVKTAMDAVAVAGAQYYLGVQSAVSITLPATALAGQEIVVVFYSGSTAATLTVSGTVIGDTPTPAANQRIELNYLWDGVAWCLVSKVDAYEAVSE